MKTKMKKTQIKLINEILLDITTDITTILGEKYCIKSTENLEEGIIGFLTKDFNFYYMEESKHFYLSFFVGTSCQQAAQITKLLTTNIDHEFFTVMEDSFWDKESGKMEFGDEAVHAKYRSYLDENGKIKCPVCENVVYKHQMLPEGTCPHCVEFKKKISWN